MENFEPSEVKKLYRPAVESSGEDNGQITIIGGSSLFHGAPLLSVKVASRIVDMVFFSSPEPSVGKVAENFKSKLFSFIWVPWQEIDAYIKKSDAVLIGPGFMRFDSEKNGKNEEGKKSRQITQNLLGRFPSKKWAIDAGSLQVMEASWIPKNAVLTPNKKEYSLLLGHLGPREAAKKYNCVIISKGPINTVCSSEKCVEVTGGNPGLTKGGTGDVLAGLTVGLLAKNNPFLAATSASYISKVAADEIYRKVGTSYNADDLANEIPQVLARFLA
jgi:hydroxyethylthiazole kinase-like uncharacterized protein yjeF